MVKKSFLRYNIRKIWKKEGDGEIMSNLYWRFGFGYPALIFWFLIVLGVFYTNGFIFFVFLVLLIMQTGFLIKRYKDWKSIIWKQIHNRAMFVFSGIAGEESGRARAENREYSMYNACEKLILLMTNTPFATTEITDTLVDLEDVAGLYFVELLYNHLDEFQELYPQVDDKAIEAAADVFRKITFGPQLVIAKVIENTYGAKESLRYGMALIFGKAK